MPSPKHSQQGALFESSAVAFVIGVAATLLVLWMLNVATNGRMIQSFFGNQPTTSLYTQTTISPLDAATSADTSAYDNVVGD